MLSVIISTYKPKYFNALERNIAETVGVPYEIIKIDNPGLMGICEAYNKGALQAAYPFLLFVHEDVEFITKDWGKILIEKYFHLPNVGILGLAGIKRRFAMCYGYGFNNLFHDEGFLFVHHHKIAQRKKALHNSPIPVKVEDGVFLAMKKQTWEELKFDETLPGFHFYDIDITLRAAEKYQNYLVYDIDLIHFSHGNFGNDWINAAISFNKRKYKMLDEPTSTERKQIRKDWYTRLTHEKISLKNRLRYVMEMGVDRFSRQAMQGFLLSKTR